MWQTMETTATSHPVIGDIFNGDAVPPMLMLKLQVWLDKILEDDQHLFPEEEQNKGKKKRSKKREEWGRT